MPIAVLLTELRSETKVPPLQLPQHQEDELMRRAITAAVIFIVLVVVIVSGFRIYGSRTVEARPQPQFGDSACYAAVPKSWGQFRGGSAQSGLAFEDNAGTLRFLTNIPCGGTPIVALEIRRVNLRSRSTFHLAVYVGDKLVLNRQFIATFLAASREAFPAWKEPVSCHPP